MAKFDAKISENTIIRGVDFNAKATSYQTMKAHLDDAQSLDKVDTFDQLMIKDIDYKLTAYQNGYTIGVSESNHPILAHQHLTVETFLKKFRGVGILADEVGMGKTIEAGMIMSELAQRKLIKSILIVASHPENLKNWMDEISTKFGLKKEQIKEITSKADFQNKDANFHIKKVNDKNYYYPLQPMIIMYKDEKNPKTFTFEKLTPQEIDNVCFDLIIVDEAHNLSIPNPQSGTYLGMEVLNNLMRTKKTLNTPYCILLSGTPHKGNLDSMFPLWYFMKKGSFANEKEAKEHYKDHLCRKVNTIAEYINKLKEEIVNSKLEKEINKQYQLYLLDYPKGSIDDFLSTSDSINNKVKNIIKKRYDDLISDFMIRNHRKDALDLSSTRFAYNYYFYPTDNLELTSPINIEFSYNTPEFSEKEIKAEITNLDTSSSSYINKTNLDDYVANLSARRKKDIKYQHIVFKMLDKVGALKDIHHIDEKHYVTSLIKAEESGNLINYLKPYTNILEAKNQAFLEIINSHPEDNILVFFADADEKQEVDQLIAFLQTNKPKYHNLLIDQGSENMEENKSIGDIFRNSTKTILIASANLHESSNFQTCCHVIINYSLSLNPIQMDQKIGRIDRINQTKDMQIYNFAQMDQLDGYVLSLLNRVGLFSGQRNDVISLTGCDNNNVDIYMCSKCSRLQRVLKSEDRENIRCNATNEGVLCDGKMVIKNTIFDFVCQTKSCGFRIERKYNLKKKSLDYYCPKRESYLVTTPTKNGKTLYHCSKECVFKHCPEAKKYTKCLARDLLAKNPDALYMELIRQCDKCNKQDCICNFSNTPTCNQCPNRSKISCYTYFESYGDEVKCPECGHMMKQEVPTTFDVFVTWLWKYAKVNGFEQFIQGFKSEYDKIVEIVSTLSGASE